MMKNPPLDVLFEDNHLLVLNKPTGLLTQPSGTNQDSLEKQAKEWIKERYQKPGDVFLQAVHRLDKAASGIVVFARTSKALSRLNQSMREKQAKKFYISLVEGGPPENEATLEHYMIHDDYHATIVFKDHPQGKIARLLYRVLQRSLTTTLLEIELETGRYHQIRLQLSTIGCPVVGDGKYGSSLSLGLNSIALHHFRLQIAHPITQDLLTFETPLPDFFSKMGF